MNILGVYGGTTLGQHDPSASIIRDGKLIAVCEEERFIRVKSPHGCLPISSIKACLQEADLNIEDIDLLVHPGETYHDVPERMKLYFNHYFGYAPPIKMINHQLAHIASAFFCSGFERAMCLSYDGYGDRISAALAIADTEKGIRLFETRELDNSLGIFYSTMTSYLGFLVSEDEYKVMGLAPYGQDEVDLSPFLQTAANGYRVNMDYIRRDFASCTMFEPLYSQKLVDLLGPPRRPNQPISERHKNIAYAAQKKLEQCIVSLINHLRKSSQLDSLCISGGVGLNCSANHVIKQIPFVQQLFVQPAASDRGLSLGCALQGAYENNITINNRLETVSMGPTYTNQQIRQALKLSCTAYKEITDPAKKAAELLEKGKVIGWFQGRSEFGPRALGNRSILADPRTSNMKDRINAKVKFREEFRPFAPSVLEEFASELFEMDAPSPFMTVAFPVRTNWQNNLQAVTHINRTARVQTVNQKALPLYHSLISEFYALTGVPCVLNTSFNIQKQPIVETPLDAIATFSATGLDALFMDNFMITKSEALIN